MVEHKFSNIRTARHKATQMARKYGYTPEVPPDLHIDLLPDLLRDFQGYKSKNKKSFICRCRTARFNKDIGEISLCI
jgi:hypothetical protein